MVCCPPQDKEQISYKVHSYARMAKGLQESSALEHAGEGSFWTLLDSGRPAVLYRIAADGRLLDSVTLALPNRDWEELARDKQGNIYIGDFGNNLNRRRSLQIYKLYKGSGLVDTISFNWPEQKTFPPEKGELNYDCEAFIWYQDQLHLFTKSRGDGMVRHYAVPDAPGSYDASLLESVFINGLVTAADISPNGSTLALLTYGKVYLFSVSAPAEMLKQPLSCLRIPWAGQSEAILFINDKSFLVGNETRKLFYVQLK